MKNRKFAKKLDSIIGGDSDPEAQIAALRRQKIETKFHHARCKAIVKLMKSVKTAAIQKTVKRIKQAKADGKEGDELGKLEQELASFKGLDHSKMADFVFYSHILKDDYLQSKLGLVGLAASLSDKKEATFMELSPKIVSSKSFQDAIKSERQDLTIFFKKLFHERLPRSQRKPKSTISAAAKESNSIKNKNAESFFVSSLNASESEGDVSDADSFVGVRSSALVFTDDEDEEFERFSDDSDVEERKPGEKKKKKNRLGQLARRRLAEKLHGQNAKHLQAGGLSVKEQEERRKERIAQKRARELRIKKKKEEDKQKQKQKEKEQEVVSNKKPKIDPALHPSWAAKLQNQNRINATTFQGQKIKFDDEAQAKKKPERQKEKQKERFSKPKQKESVSEPPKIDPKLHPSWAAKLQQQHKTNATAFQGQKIKFDDEE